MENNNYSSYEFFEMLEPRRSNSLPMKCRSSTGNVPKLSSANRRDAASNNAKQDEVQKLFNKIKNTFSILKSSKDNQNHPSSVIETDYERDFHKDRLDSQSNLYGTFEDAHEYKACCTVARQLKKCLAAAAKTKQLVCDLILPVNLLTRVSHDIARMSHCEPCGMRGCVIFVALENGSQQTMKLGRVVCDPSIVPTFELYLTFKEDTRSWATVRKLLFFVRTCFREDKNSKKNVPKVLSDGFQLVKKKLYRPN